MEDAIAAAAWITNTYEALTSLDTPATAFEKQIAEINRQFNLATEQARNYGLATESIAAVQARAVEQARLERQITTQGGLLSRSRILGDFLAQAEVTSGSPQSQFEAARRQFDEAVSVARVAGNGADLSRVVQAAGTLRGANASFNGAGAAGASFESGIVAALRGLGATLDLPSFAQDFDASLTRNTNRVEDAIATLTAVAQAQRDELLNIRLAVATSR